MNVYGVILAGGGGTRFWPLSRKDLPKQFLNLTGTDLMVNETIDRMSGVIDQGNIFIVTSKEQAELTYQATEGRIEKDHILLEPAARNTAACIAYAAETIMKKYGDGVMCILPSDHYIKDNDSFRKVMMQAIDTAKETDALITVGIHPTFAATGYGYIRYDKSFPGPVKEVAEFVEKPDIKTAKQYLQEECYLWNSGMFFWKVGVILKQFQTLLPDIYQKVEQIGDAINTPMEEAVLNEVYPVIPKISIDYGIMERADNVKVIAGEFGWNDVGSWDALQALYEEDANGNVIYGEQIHVDTHNCICYAKTKLIAALGVEDLIIVEADDAILVCHRDKAQEVRRVVEELKNKGKEHYL